MQAFLSSHVDDDALSHESTQGVVASCSTWHVQIEVVELPDGARARARVLGASATRAGRSGAGEGSGASDPYEELHDWQSLDELTSALAGALQAQGTGGTPHQRRPS